jgi:hypothetical protein
MIDGTIELEPYKNTQGQETKVFAFRRAGSSPQKKQELFDSLFFFSLFSDLIALLYATFDFILILGGTPRRDGLYHFSTWSPSLLSNSKMPF